MNAIEYNGYRIVGLDTFALVKIQAKGSGTIPGALEGHFTKVEIAKQHIDNYLNSLVTNKKRKANAKEESPSSDQ